MGTFKKIVIGVAGVVLVISLVMIGMSISNSKYSEAYPPVTAACPDYWKLNPTTGMCENTHNLGNCASNEDFTKAPYNSSAEGLCAKKMWADSCNVTWDGITNNETVCN